MVMFDPISNKEAKEAKELADQIVKGEVDTGVLRTNIDQKLNDLEAEYAPQLLQKADKSELVNAPTYLPKQNRVRDMLTYFQSEHGFSLQSSNGLQADDTVDYVLGSQSLKLSTLGDGGSVFSRNANIGTFDLTSKQVQINIKVAGVANLTELHVYLFSGSTSNFFTMNVIEAPTLRTWLNEGEWGTVTVNVGSMNKFGSPTRDNITGIQIRAKDNGSGSVSVNWNGISFIDEPIKGVVSITMDDGWLSQYTEARKAMDKYGFPATAYIIADLIGTNPDRWMNMEQLKKLRDANGWEIASHAYAYDVHEAKYINVSEEVMDNDFRSLKNWLVNNGFQSGVEHFAYPGGAYNSLVLSYVRKYFGTARTVSGKNHETWAPADPHRLRTLIVPNTMSIETFKTHVDTCIDNNTWLILCYHQFENPAVSSTQVTPENYQKQMDYLALKGVPVRTMGDVARHGF